MGADLLRSDEWVRARILEASEKTGEDLERLCLRGPEKKLMRAAFVQPILTIICLGYWKRLSAAGLQADVVAGHSLGEIAALAAAGVLTPEQAVEVATERGRLMDEVADRFPGGMAAVFMTLQETEARIERFGMTDRVFVANDNAAEQVVVSASLESLEAFAGRMNEEQAGRCKPLRVSGPWHSPLLEDARARFSDWLAGIPFQTPTTPLISNATAQVDRDPEHLRAHAARQLTHRVRWRETMDELRAMKPSALLEVGPRRVLAGLARLNGFGEETAVRGVDSLRAVEQVSADQSIGGGK